MNERSESVIGCIRWLGQLMKRRCIHEFAIEDLREVKPDGADDRVEWPCSKCGHIFRAHCGLDIAPKHGFMFRRSERANAGINARGAAASQGGTSDVE